jgi:hypothetical protein
MTDPIKSLDMMARGAYDLQHLRISAGLRICAGFREKLKEGGGLDVLLEDEEKESKETETKEPEEEGPSEFESEVDEDPIKDTDSDEKKEEKRKAKELKKKAKKILDQLKKRYRRLTDGVARNRTLPKREGFTGDGIISEFAELVLIHEYLELEKQETVQFKYIGEELQSSGIIVYFDWLVHQKGIGPALSAILLTKFDVYLAERPSQFFAIAGLDVGPGIETDPNNKLARSRRKEHLIEREYEAKDGTIKTKMSTTFNPWLQAKMLGVLGPSLMKAKSPYKEHYDRYKHRISTDPNRRKGTLADKKREWAEGKKTEEIWHKNRIHRASMRYMVKQFIGDFWRKWREAEDLPTVPPYHEGVLGHKHHGPDPAEAAE